LVFTGIYEKNGWLWCETIRNRYVIKFYRWSDNFHVKKTNIWKRWSWKENKNSSKFMWIIF